VFNSYNHFKENLILSRETSHWADEFADGVAKKARGAKETPRNRPWTLTSMEASCYGHGRTLIN